MEVSFIVLCCILCFHGNQCLTPIDTSVAIDDGTTVRKLGVLFDNPLLRMLGKVFQHTENLVGKAKDEIFQDLCDLHPCSPWTEWSVCTAAEHDSYGIQNRSRKCGLDSPFCIQPQAIDEDPNIENGIKICEGVCKVNYTLTSGGYCLKLYNQTMTKSQADTKCVADGGFVVNINSKTKSDSVHELLKMKRITSETIWIDGRRSRRNSPWSFQYEIAPVWTNWYRGQPSDRRNQYCRVEENADRKWFDRNCDKQYWFVCEVPLKNI